MSRTTKVYIKFGGYEERYLASVKGADENDLAILAGIFLVADEDGCAELSRIESALGFSSADVAASVKYWKGAGVVSAAAPKTEKKSEVVPAAHKGGVITHSGVEEYTNDELTHVLENRVGTAFVDAAQQVMGKMFNKNEVGKLIGIVDQLGFEEEAVLAILAYCVRLGKTSISYAEKIAVSFHDEDVLTVEAVHAQIDYIERRNTVIEKIRGLYGFGGRALSPTEKKYFTAWTETYGFSFEIIEKAYHITVDATHSPVPKYTDKILKNWYELGLKTVSEIDGYIEEYEREKAAKPSGTGKGTGCGPKNEYAEEWFEQLLQKNF